MEELKLNGYEMKTCGVEATILKMLNIDTTGMAIGAGPRVYAELDKKIAGKTVCVELEDMLLYGHRIIDLVTFCYERKCGFEIKNGGIGLFMDYLVARYISDHHMPQHVAEETVRFLFPHETFIHNKPR